MTSANPNNRELFTQHISKHHDDFLDSIEEIKRMLKAKDALVTLERLNEFTAKPLGQTIPVEEITELAKYSRSNPGRKFKTGPVNESAVLLLSAYLEGFVEALYEECLRHLLHENFASAKVLDIMTKDARRQFMNPSPSRIGELFRKLTLDISSNFGPAFKCKEIKQLIDTRNKIAHGVKEGVSDEKIDEYLHCVKDFAGELTREVSSEITTLSVSPS